MKLLTLEVENFMGYYGKFLIDFKSDNDAKIILFLGENGHGKSTIHHAARWCLYGKTEKNKKVIDEEKLFNRIAKNSALNDKTVVMKVKLDWESEGKIYSLTRECSYQVPSSPLVNFWLRIDGENPIPQSNVKNYVQRFFPKEISHFFFFDGELQDEFDKMAENDDEANYIKEQVEKTLNIPTVQAAKDLIEEKRSIEAREIEAIERKQNKNESKLKQIAESKKLLDLNQELLAQSITYLDPLLIAKKEIEDKFGNIDKMKAEHENLKRIEALIDRFEKEKNESLVFLRSEFSENVRWSVIANKLEEKQRSTQESEVKYKQSKSELDSLNSRLDELLKWQDSNVCPLCEQRSEKDKSYFENRINEIRSNINNIQIEDFNVIEKHSQYLKEIGYSKDKINKLKDDIKEYNEIVYNLLVHKNELKEAISNLSFSPDINVRSLAEELTITNQNIAKYQADVDKYTEVCKNLRDTIKSLENQLIKSPEISKQKQFSYLAYAYLSDLFEKSKNNYALKVKQQVEKYASDTFKEIISEKKFTGLKINDKFGVEITLNGGGVEPLRSTGQGKVSAISLVSGLLQTAMADGFVLMDTPFGSLDLGHRKQVCLWAANSKLNVSLFMHSGEFVLDNDLEMLGTKVNRIYIIQRVSEDQSTIRLLTNV